MTRWFQWDYASLNAERKLKDAERKRRNKIKAAAKASRKRNR